MKSRTLRVALLCGTWIAGAVSVSAQTVDDLVARNIQARGGLTRLKAVQTIRQTSDLTMDATRASVVVYGKRPNLIRQEITVGGQTIVNGFDGRTPWMINPLTGARGAMAITGPQADVIREQSNFDGPLVDYKARGYRIELGGTELAGGRQLYRLRITGPNQLVQDCFLDATTGLEAKIVTRAAAGIIEQEMGDFREIDGIMVPFSIRTTVNGVMQSQVAVKTVQFNVPIEDRIFAAP
jgi:hypothetical protein